MRFFKSAAAILLAFVMVLLVGCQSAEQVDPEFLLDKDGNIMLTETNVHWYGRTYRNKANTGTHVSWTDSGFEIHFSGTSVEVQMTGIGSRSDWLPYVEVFIDDENFEGEKIQLSSGTKWYTLAQGLSEGEHTVRVIKLTEAMHGLVTVYGIRFPDGGKLLTPNACSERKIEFLGDSITCGHTDLLNKGDADIYSPETQDGWQTYAAFTARNLDAEFNCFCISGWTIYRRWDVDGGDQMSIPDVYDQIDPLHGNTDTWDTEKFIPDVVVIALGTNDFGVPSHGLDTIKAFKDKYYDFVTQLREYYPDATIIATMGMMNSSVYPYIEEVVKQFNDEGDGNVYCMKENYMGQQHPVVEEHQQTADQLTQFIKDIKGW